MRTATVERKTRETEISVSLDLDGTGDADNSHHIVETCFKGLARALRQAVTPDERLDGASPSSKGSL